MRRIGRYRMRKQKKALIIGSLSLLLFLCVGYAAFSTNLSITAKGNIKEKSRVIQSWDMNSQTDFHSDFYKENIVSATFLDNNKVANNATESWNISEDKENGGVLAWVVPNNNDNTKYDLYIGAKGGVIANEDSSYLFYNFQNVKEINFDNNFDTYYMVNMYQMFRTCGNLKILDLSSFNTSNVTNMSDLFNMWDSEKGDFVNSELTEIIFGDNFITNNVTTMHSMFAGLEKLTMLDITGFDTSNVTDMYHMFLGCESLPDIKFGSNFNTSKVTNMSGMFQQCRSLTTLDLSGFDTSNVTDMEAMFSMWESSFETDTGNLQKLDLSNFDTSKVTTMRDMFVCNKNLVELDISNFNTSNVINMWHMFTRCEKLSVLNLCSFDTRNVTDMHSMLADMTSLRAVYVGSNWSTSQADTTYLMSNSGISSVTKGMC